MILELNAALEIVNKPCPKQHGMSQAEKDELKAAVSEVEKYHEENDKLSKMVADISAENVRLRAALRSAKSEYEETEIYQKYRQAQITIQEQQQQIQALKAKPKSNSPRLYKDDYSLLNKIKELENELKGQRLENDAVMNELEQKKKQIKDLQKTNEYNKNLHDTKQKLNDKAKECQSLCKESDASVRSISDKTVEQLREENRLLVSELQSREQEIAALEDEVIKLLSYCEGNGANDPIDNQEQDERMISLEAMIQERDEKIETLNDDLKNINKSHYEDIEVLEEHISKLQQEIEEKNKTSKDLMIELKESLEKTDQVQKECEDKLNKQFNELAIAIREREVRIATLEGEHEAIIDTMQREKELLQEEIEELSQKLELVLQEMEEKENCIQELKAMTDQKNSNDSEVLDLKEQLQKLSHNDERWKEKVFALEYKLKDQLAAYRSLKHKWTTTSERNEKLNKLLVQSRKDAESNLKPSKTEQILQRLSYELRQELEDKSRECDQAKIRLAEFQILYNEQVEMSHDLAKQLQKRENMLSHSLSTFDTLKEHKEFMENILYEQATGTHSFRERSESSIMKY
ncbi:hypothetical protein G6F46_006013 [Rhizopus delemar]|uniref:Uncharacterized protein n=2 Tax=Rhizopus TaxID=4842 RepID=A0A9P7CP62_9FUNG|nr:hypothetical protein G6F55_008642 [Rhizopus delemar]KAG1549982.1 hypothetical protein G6F51_002738 [Rhizopus arrhizus]KAG1492712.1 hypothetical protein G6F54_009107 [Rhizopus delemar]KAG1511840.1 hypothetical protein G6F53_005630 [Rhizopus delemar]KAG1522179.1 hypothetical protein G6F52_006087 [Rhizopus delemar]